MSESSGPIFILGCGRSGTTLLRLMLNRHPRIAIPGETWFFPDLYQIRTRLSSNGEWREAVAAHVENCATFSELGVSREQLRDEMSRIPFERWSDVVAVANLAFARAEGKERWGDKTPGYVRNLPLLKELFPAAFVLHMIRDARDVAASFLEVPFGPKQPIEAAEYWKRDVLLGRKDGPSHFGNRYLEIRYEELISDPEGVVRRVLDHIGEDFDPIVLQHHTAAESYLRPEHHWHALTTKPITRSRVGRWRETLTERQAQLIEIEAGSLLRELGYSAEARRSFGSFLEWAFVRTSKVWREAILGTKVAMYRTLKAPLNKFR